jgi:hypothetical protein
MKDEINAAFNADLKASGHKYSDAYLYELVMKLQDKVNNLESELVSREIVNNKDLNNER